MLRLIYLSFGLMVIGTSCEKCKQCTYSYTETVIVATLDGEEEQVNEYEDLILLDEDGESFGEECLKKSGADDGNNFTIEAYYQLEAETTELDNFEYVCVDL